MKIEDIRSVHGPNIYIDKPVLIMRLDLQDLTEMESYQVPGFVDRLIAQLPGVHSHHCAKGQPGGFIERLRGGTYFGHIVEHVALELTEYIGTPCNFGKTLYAGRAGLYDVIVEWKEEHSMRHLLETAVHFVQALVDNKPFSLERELESARAIFRKYDLGPSTKAIVEAAKKRNIPVYRLNEGSLLQLGTGKYAKRIEATITGQTSAIAVDIAGDKELTKRFLRQAEIPVPFGEVVRDEAEALSAFARIGEPVVIKPLAGNQGKGVSLNLQTEREVRRAFELAKHYDDYVLVEEYVAGRHYRILVVNGIVEAVSERLPASVTGDGIHTIEQLIELENRNPKRGSGHEKPLTRIAIDSVVVNYLARNQRSLSVVPAEGEQVFLRDNSNLSTGGTAVDVTADLHPSTAEMATRVARIIGLDVCGIDVVVDDISKPFRESGGVIIEVNAAPGIRMHHFPSEGEPRDVGASIVNVLFPPGMPSRIPLFSITGTNGKTTTTRMIGHIVQSQGKTVGMTTTDGIYIGGSPIAKGDTTGPRSARTVLSDPAVEVAVLETARGGIVRSGLGYDMADIAIITNISPDHIGQDGIEQVDDLIFIKSLVAERVHPRGTVILNADDPNVLRIVEKVKANIVFFSLRPDNGVVKRHLAIGGKAYILRGGWLVESRGDQEWPLLPAEQIPVTMGGSALFHVANALAAIAACRAFGMTRDAIARELRVFRSDLHNPGRSSLFQIDDCYVLVDYGHNPDSFAAICKMAEQLPTARTTGVVGVPGDRNNSIVEAAARVAAEGFQRLIIKEDVDTRGRQRGEIAQMLCRTVREYAPGKECLIIHEEPAALEWAINTRLSGEFIVVFYEKLEPILDVLKRYQAVSVSDISRPSRLPLAKV